MQGLFFEQDAGAHVAIRGAIAMLGFWTAWRAGKAAAEGWSNYPLAVVYTMMLACMMQFLHHALFSGSVFDAYNWTLDFVSLLVFSTAGFRYRRTNQMVNNYYWLYERTSPFTWKELKTAGK